MLRISKKADYAVFLLGAIARQGAFPGGCAADTVVSAHEIARQAGLNKSVVANLLKEFARFGLLDSVRGLRGGYRLTHPPSQISLGQILEVVEGKFVLVDCVPHETAMGDGAKSEDPEGGSRSEGSSSEGSSSEGSGSEGSSSKGSTIAADQSVTATSPQSDSCSLISFCPSRQPMRVMHQRITKLFAEIFLDELCSMTPVCSTDGRS